MINLSKFYEIAPELLVKKKTRKVSQCIPDTKSNLYSESRQSFRNNLLRNLETFRAQKGSMFNTKIYNCPSRKSVLSVQTSRHPSIFSNFSMEEFNFISEKKSKKYEKAQKIQKSLMESLVIEKSVYQNEILSKLKSTLPKFLESPRKKALRKIV